MDIDLVKCFKVSEFHDNVGKINHKWTTPLSDSVRRPAPSCGYRPDIKAGEPRTDSP